MAATTITRKHRRTRKAPGPKKLATFGAAAATAVALGVGAATVPNALPDAGALTLDSTTTGPLFGILDALGLDSFDLTVPVLGDTTVNLSYQSGPEAIYDSVNTPGFSQFPGTRNFLRPNPLAVLGGGTIAPVVLAIGGGTNAAIEAYKALLEAGAGNAPDGFTDLTPRGLVTLVGTPCTGGIGCAQGTNITNLALVLLRNPGTPNGGLSARFGPVLDLFGIDPVSPQGSSSSSTGLQVNGGLINVALAYDFVSDAPITLNPIAWSNSVLAASLPTYLLPVLNDIPGSIKGAGVTSIIASLTGLLTLNSPFTSYSAILSPDLPLLEPLRLPARLFNLVSFALGSELRVRTPIADALQPANEILVNIAYTDVETPTEGGTYNRTWDQFGDYKPLLSEAPLTTAELLKVPGDYLKALWDGTVASVQNVLQNGLFYQADPGAVAAVPASVAASLKTTPAPVQAVEDNSGGGSSTASSLREEIAASGSGDDGSDTVGSATGGNNSGGNNSGGGSNSGGSSSAGDASQAGGKSARKGVGGSKRAAAAKAADEKAAS